MEQKRIRGSRVGNRVDNNGDNNGHDVKSVAKTILENAKLIPQFVINVVKFPKRVSIMEE